MAFPRCTIDPSEWPPVVTSGHLLMNRLDVFLRTRQHPDVFCDAILRWPVPVVHMPHRLAEPFVEHFWRCFHERNP